MDLLSLEGLPEEDLRRGVSLLVPWEVALLLTMASPAFRKRVLSVMRMAHERQDVEILIKHLGRVRVEDVEMAQKRLLQAAAQLDRSDG